MATLAPKTTGVRKGHELDVSRVLPLLKHQGVIESVDVPVEVGQFSHGQSNPTYLLSLGTEGEAGSQKLVLRKQPPGKLLRGAHAVDREYQCMTALVRCALELFTWSLRPPASRAKAAAY